MAKRLRSETTEEPRAEPVIEIPYDPVNEQVVLAAALVDRPTRKLLTTKVRGDAFRGEGHAALWGALCEAERKSLDSSDATLHQLSAGKVDAQVADALRATFGAKVPANLDHHVEMLRWDRARAQVVEGPLSQLARALKDPTTVPERVRALARQVGTSFDGHSDTRYLRDPQAVVREQMVEIQARAQTQACFPYGIDTLDMDETGAWRLIPGAKPGQVTVVTGVPGSGKSTLTARAALGLARQRRRVLYGAWEMTSGVTLELLACMSLNWSRSKLMTGNLLPAEMKTFEQRMSQIADYVRFVEQPFHRERGKRAGNDEALDIIHGYIADSGCDVAIFDLWKRCLRWTKPEDEEQALIRQQAIAEETQCHCILVQQQRMKDIEQRKDKRPTREGIKGSGAWTEVADTIFGVHRPALWKNIPDNVLEVDILKQRYAPWPLAVEFDWDAERGGIDNGRTIDYDPPGAMRETALDEFVSGGKKATP